MCSEQRIKQPVLVIGYGAGGADWIGRAATLAFGHNLLAPLIQAGVVQFWVVGEEPSHAPDRVQSVSSHVTPPELRELLDRGRSARLAPLGEIDLHRIVVFERWALFDEASCHRIELRAHLDAARRVNCTPDKASEFDIEWLSLVDCIRPPAPPDEESIERIRRLITGDDLPDHRLLIDRQDASSAIIDRDLADNCFLDVLIALMTSDFTFRRKGAGDARIVTTLSREATGDVIPFSVIKLRHQERDIASVHAAQLRGAILKARGDTTLIEEPGNVQALDALVGVEESELRKNSYSTQRARVRREESTRELLRRALVRRQFDEPLEAVESARNAAKRAFGGRAGAFTPTRTGAAVALIQAPAALWEGTWWLVSAIFAAAAGGIWWALMRRQSGEHPDPAAHSEPERHQDIFDQWMTLCDALSAALHEWRDCLIESERSADVPAPDVVWRRVENNPYQWALASRNGINGGIPITPTVYAQLADEWFRRAARGEKGALGESILAVARKRVNSDRGIAASIVKLALEGHNPQELRNAVAGCPLLARPAGKTHPVEVVWLRPSGLDVEQTLGTLESASTRGMTRFLTHDDPGHTTRIAFGEPQDWTGLLSLSFL